jgi:hypothetical protein
MSDQIEQLRAMARLDLPAAAVLLLGTLSDEEWRRLEDLMRDWPPERGQIPRRRIRMCLACIFAIR